MISSNLALAIGATSEELNVLLHCPLSQRAHARARSMDPVMPCQGISNVSNAGQGGGPGPGADPPTHRKPYSRILMIAGQESLWQRKLSQATSCDRLARISFMVWKGCQIWKPQHYEAAHEKAFLSILPLLFSYPGWNEREKTLSALHDLKPRRASQA